MDVISIISPYIANPATILTVIVGLAVWAIWSGRRLCNGTGMLVSHLEIALEQVRAAEGASAFTTRYEAISQELSDDPILGPRWREFQQSLLIPDHGFIRATSPADTWFGAGLLRAPPIGLDPRFHAALPGLLVGAGLLFTFLGLAVALHSAGDIVAENVTQVERNQALHQLLSAASLKFWTSVAGLFLSIVYALVRKDRLRRVDSALEAFHGALDERLPLITPVQIQAEANTQLEAQTTALQAFSNDLAINLAGVFDNAFDKRLGEHIGPLAASMERLSESLTGRNEDAMQQMMEAFLDKLQGGTGTQMAGVADKLANLAAGLEGLQNGMQEAARRMTEGADAMARRMGDGAEQAMAGVSAQMSTLVESLRALTEQARDASADAGRDLARRLEAAAGGFERSAQTVAETLAEAARGLEQRMGSQAEDSTRRLAQQFDAMIESLRSLADNSRSMGASALDAVAARIDTAASSFQGVSQRIAKALEDAAKQTGGTFDRGATDAVDRIVAATEGMRTELQDMLSALRVSLGEAGAAMTDGSKASAAAMRDSLDQAGTGLAGALGGAASTLQQAGEAAALALRQGGESAGAHMEGAGSGISVRTEALGRQIGGLAEVAARMARGIGELNAATGETAHPLTQAAEHLRLVADSMRAATIPLTEVAQRAAGLVDQVAGTAKRLEAAQNGASRLTDSLDKATLRFEGVDKNLGMVLTQLQAGIARFAKDVTDFVSGIDSNLAKATTQVGNLVKSLDDTIQDFNDNNHGRPG
jgi:ABC-type transporter Mla subunit MlaD